MLTHAQFQTYILNLEEKFKYKEALRNIFNISSLGNKFMQDNKPAAKSDSPFGGAMAAALAKAGINKK